MSLSSKMLHQQQFIHRPPSFKPVRGSSRHRSARRIRLCTRAAMPITGEARRIFKQQEANIEGDPTRFLQITEAYWKTLKQASVTPPTTAKEVVKQVSGSIGGGLHVDACICGGTLGIFVALALQQKGFKTCIVEKRKVAGRTQEWNISRGEIEALVELGLVTQEQLEAAIVTEFNPIRVGFKGGEDIWVNDCLNLGVSPERLVKTMRDRYVEAGGVILEGTAFLGAEVFEDGVKMAVRRGAGAGPLELGDANRPNAVDSSVYNKKPASAVGGTEAAPTEAEVAAAALSEQHTIVNQAAASGELRTRLLLDCMGHFSDIVKQLRVGTAPHGMCLVVGSCAEGIPEVANKSGDLLYTFSDAELDMQMFWEAFPAEGGKSRTTYMFTYTDAHPTRPCFEQLLDKYFELLPSYQGVPLDDLSFKRVLFGGFPCYNNGPLKAGFDRVLQVGDASASASPLSFGGFGSMVRHIPRLSAALSEALTADRLSRSDLSLIQPYQPSLSAAWLFQRSMSFRPGQQRVDPAATAAVPSSAAPPRNNIVASPSSLRSPASAAAPQHVPHAPQPLDYSLPSTSRGWLQPDHINKLLACNFSVMAVLGDRCLRPFLQDSIVLGPLSLTMTGMMLADPITILKVLGQIGPSVLVPWFGHFISLATYRLLHAALSPLRPVIRDYTFQRVLDALQYGSGSDYTYHAAAPVVKPEPVQLPISKAGKQGAERRRPEVGGVVGVEGMEAGALLTPLAVQATAADATWKTAKETTVSGSR